MKAVSPPKPERRPLVEWLETNLRIKAIREMFSMVEVKRHEVTYLIGLALIYAFAEGVGLSVLLPVLQYAENGSAAASTGGGLIWEWPGLLAQSIGIPLNLVTLLVLAFIPVLLRQLAFYLNNWYSALISNRITARMRVDIFERMMDADPDFLTSRPQGEFTGAILNQTNSAGQGVIQVIRLFSITVQVVLYVTMLGYLSVPLTALSVFAGLAVSRLLHRIMAQTRAFGAQAAEATQGSFAAIVERIALARLIKMRAREGQETANVRRFSESWSSANVSIGKLTGSVEVIADPLLMLSAFLTLYFAIAMLGMHLAELGMLLYLLTRLNSKVKDFNTFRQFLSSNIASIHIVRDLTADARGADSIKSGVTPFPGLHDTLELDDVTFTFPNAQKPTLAHITAHIKAGAFTAIVGRSGSGKSTFVELLPRLRDVTAGCVRYDGIDVREFELATLRRDIGYLTQEPLLFNDTLRMNMLYGLDHEVDDREIGAALDPAHAGFVKDLPDGLDTRLGDRGVRFSGGERQRIALARVLLHRPSLLILDEPTSALDSESERYIQETLADLHGTTTIIVIAHRLATVVAADQLLVMEDGRIVQNGTHDELVSADGPYRHLFESQLFRRD